jgi:O-antigen/teichoic acid export membrane protein
MIQRLKPKSEFNQNVLTLMTGATIAQAIPVAISPILTRIYTPEDFGVLALFIAITSIFGSIANGRYELAIMLPKKDEDAINIFALGFVITTIVSFILLLTVVIFHDHFVTILNNKEIGFWLYFIPIAVFLTGIFNLLNYFNNRKKYYSDLRNAIIVKSIVMTIIQLSIGLVKNGAIGLISGHLVSKIAANAKLIKNISKDKFLISKISKIKIIALAKRYRKFPKFSMPSGVLNNSSMQLPIVMLGSFFNAATVGFYSLSNKLISMPMVLIGNSIGHVFFQQASIIKNDKEKLANLTEKTYFRLLYVGIVPFSVLFAFSDSIFSFIFGSEWVVAGEYAQALSLWILFVFISSPLSSLTSLLGKQKEALYFNIVILLSRIFVILFGSLVLQDPYQTILIYGFTGFIFWFFWSFYLLNLAKVPILITLLKSVFIMVFVIGLFSLLRIF